MLTPVPGYELRKRVIKQDNYTPNYRFSFLQVFDVGGALSVRLNDVFWYGL